MSTIPTRYATALLQHALENHLLDRIYEDTLNFQAICKAHPALVHFLKNPIIKHHTKEALLQAIFQPHYHTLTLRFFSIVLQKKRHAYLLPMIHTFLAQYQAQQGIKQAQVTTAFPLSPALVERFQALVHRITPCKTVLVTPYVDPTLLGGYLLEVDDKKLDQRITTQLQKLIQHIQTTHPPPATPATPPR